MSDIDYGKLIVQPGKGYSQNSIVKWSYYNSPIVHNFGELSGNSRRWGDASADVQKQVINILIDTSRQFGLNDHEIALVLAIARHESGFNPDAAAGTTSAQGLGQFLNNTGAAYDLTDANRWDTNAQAVAFIAHFVDNQILATSRGQGEEYIYKYHHDGPTKDYGGLNISETGVMPYVAAFEQVVKSVPVDQQASSISQAASSIVVTLAEPSWIEMLYGELQDGASAISGWIPEKLSSMLQNSGISGTMQNQENQQIWTFNNGLKVVDDFVNNLSANRDIPYIVILVPSRDEGADAVNQSQTVLFDNTGAVIGQTQTQFNDNNASLPIPDPTSLSATLNAAWEVFEADRKPAVEAHEIRSFVGLEATQPGSAAGATWFDEFLQSTGQTTSDVGYTWDTTISGTAWTLGSGGWAVGSGTSTSSGTTGGDGASPDGAAEVGMNTTISQTWVSSGYTEWDEDADDDVWIDTSHWENETANTVASTTPAPQTWVSSGYTNWVFRGQFTESASARAVTRASILMSQ